MMCKNSMIPTIMVMLMSIPFACARTDASLTRHDGLLQRSRHDGLLQRFFFSVPGPQQRGVDRTLRRGRSFRTLLLPNRGDDGGHAAL